MARRDREPLRPPNMIDLVFDLASIDSSLTAHALPPTWRDELGQALQAALPELSDGALQVHPLRPVLSAEGLLLPRRARLHLRLPLDHMERLQTHLTGLDLTLGSGTLRLTQPRQRPLDSAPTLHTEMLSLNLDLDAEGSEALFETALRAELSAIDPTLDDMSLILGTPRTLPTQTCASGAWHGFPVVIHDLTAHQSLRLQEHGLGAWQRFGLGVLVPYKTITGL